MSPFEPLQLPNGAVIPNRIAKASMEENMADAEHGPSQELIQLYQTWGEGGAGLILTGNVMIDRRAMTGPAGVVLEDDSELRKFQWWARAGRARGAQFWVQINHPGRQIFANLGQQAVAPSAVSLDMGNLSKLFASPRAMTEEDISEVIRRFARSAELAERAGFTGVEIHSAHGYLLSQFLSPLANKRTDRWGGSLENRARLLVEVVKAVRAAVTPAFCVGVKLNSADFQRGGFDAAEAREVVEMLNGFPVDLVELSGGTYEAPAMQGEARDGRTLAREAYFLEFAREIAGVAKMPLMVTGGIRRRAVVEQVLASGVAMAGIATGLALAPQLPLKWRSGEDVHPTPKPVRWRHKPLAALASMALVKYQLRRIGSGQPPKLDVSPLRALITDRVRMIRRTREYRRWMSSRATNIPLLAAASSA